jgi:hypothetical protein
LSEQEAIGYVTHDLNGLHELNLTVDENGEWHSEDIQLTTIGQNFLNAYLRGYLSAKRDKATHNLWAKKG